MPAREIFPLLLGEAVDPNAHGSELEAGDLAVHLLGDWVDAVFELGVVGDDVFGGEGLVGGRLRLKEQ